MNEKSNKLISLISSLDKSQRRKCKKLVESSYFGGNEDLLGFYTVIINRVERGKSLGKKEIWAEVFRDGRKYSDVRFRKFTSDLYKLIKQYIIQEMLAEDEGLVNYLYLSGLEKQNPEKLIRAVERNWDSIATIGDDADYQSYLFRHLLENRRYHLQNFEHRPYVRANVEEISSTLDVYFIVVKLRSAILAQSRIQTEKQGYDLLMVDDVVSFLDSTGAYLDHTAVAIYYYMFKMLNDESSDEPYFHYKKLLIEDTSQLAVEQAYELIQPALNYCRRKINEGQDGFLTEYLEIYRYGLDHESVFDNGVLDPLQFRNTILIAMRHGDYDWTENYIQSYQDRLPDSQRANAVNYNSATLYFYLKDYGRALEFLRDVEYENTTYNLNAKTMLLAIYYETDADGPLDSLFDAITAYLNRHKELPRTATEAYGNLVSYTRRLTRMLPGDQKALTQLKNDLSAQTYVASRPWLEEKIEEFATSR